MDVNDNNSAKLLTTTTLIRAKLTAIGIAVTTTVPTTAELATMTFITIEFAVTMAVRTTATLTTMTLTFIGMAH